MEISKLTNEELLFMYINNERALKHMKSVIKRGGYTVPVLISGHGRILVFEPLSDEKIEQMKVSPIFEHAKSIDQKLKEPAQLIEQTCPELYQNMVELLNKENHL